MLIEPVDVCGVWTGELRVIHSGMRCAANSEMAALSRLEAMERRSPKQARIDWPEAFAIHAAREAKLLVDLRLLNLGRRGFRTWMSTTVLIAVSDDDGRPDEPAEVTALVKWPFAIRKVVDDTAPAPFRLIHLSSGYSVAHHGDPHSLRRLVNAVSGLVD